MKNIITILLVSVTLICCSKKSGVSAPAITKENLVGSYKLAATTVTYNGVKVDVLALYPCRADDIYTLNANDTYTVSDGATTCTPSSNDSGTWSLSGKIITLGTTQFTITSFDGTTIQATSSFTYQGQTLPSSSTFKKQ